MDLGLKWLREIQERAQTDHFRANHSGAPPQARNDSRGTRKTGEDPADVERGERNLSLLNILKLGAALRVHPGKLFVKF